MNILNNYFDYNEVIILEGLGVKEMEYSLKNIELNRLKEIYKHIEHDFPPNEHAPYNVIYWQLKKGSLKGLVLCKGEYEVAYSIFTETSSEYTIVGLLAVYDEYRGHGFGTEFLKELKNIYSDRKGIIVEVEKPERAKNDAGRIVSQKRIKFYERAGFYLVPDIDYSIWDVPMHLMVLPLKASEQIINEEIGQVIYDFYLTLLGKRFINKMKFSRVSNESK